MTSKFNATCVLLIVLFAAAAGCDNDGADGTQQVIRDSGGPAPDAAADRADADGADSASRSGDGHHRATSAHGATVAAKPPLDISGYLSAKDLADLTDGPVVSHMLAGKPASSSYNSMRLSPKGQPGFGVGLQVWAFDKAPAAADRLGSLRQQYLNVDDAPKNAPVDDRAFVSERARIQSYVFIAADAPTHVVAVSCGDKMCDQDGPAQLMKLAGQINDRFTAK